MEEVFYLVIKLRNIKDLLQKMSVAHRKEISYNFLTFNKLYVTTCINMSNNYNNVFGSIKVVWRQLHTSQQSFLLLLDSLVVLLTCRGLTEIWLETRLQTRQFKSTKCTFFYVFNLNIEKCYFLNGVQVHFLK